MISPLGVTVGRFKMSDKCQTDHTTSVHSRCVIELFWLCLCVLLPLVDNIFVGFLRERFSSRQLAFQWVQITPLF